MALTVCDECKGKVSTEATVCPACGAVRAKPTSRVTLLLGGLFSIAVAWSVVNHTSQPENAARAEVAQSPEQHASESQAKAADVMRFVAARAVSRGLKESAREPESVKFSVLAVSADAHLVCAELRGRNGFGGLSLEHVVVLNDKAQRDAAVWNKHCTSVLYDYRHAAQ